MKRKILLLIVSVAVLVSIGGGFYIWEKYFQNKLKNQPTPTPSPKIQYPKVESFQVPILMYHYIRDAEEESTLGKNLSVSPENFDLQIKWLKDNDYETLRVIDLTDPERKILSKIAFEKKKPIILTFDDGYKDAYTEAFPILQKYQMTATFYIIRDYVSRSNYMNEEQIAALEKAGMEIGSHTLSHPDLTKLDPAEAQSQINQSKNKALTFCYPSGKYNNTIIELVQSAGYRAAVTTHFGIADQNSSILALPRVRVENGSAKTLQYKIEAAFESSK